MSGPLKKSSIEIQRSKIENFLMNVKEFVQKNNRKVFTGFLFIIIFLTLSLSAYIFYNRSAEKALVKFEVILEKYKSDPSKPEIMENTITELHKLISETRFGFINELCYYYLANILFDNNKFNDAYDAFSKFIKKSSSKDVFVPIAVNKSALCLEEMGKLDEAIDLLNR
jgi:predicted negative regulator of RcsB-dependent stress response